MKEKKNQKVGNVATCFNNRNFQLKLKKKAGA